MEGGGVAAGGHEELCGTGSAKLPGTLMTEECAKHRHVQKGQPSYLLAPLQVELETQEAGTSRCGLLLIPGKSHLL